LHGLTLTPGSPQAINLKRKGKEQSGENRTKTTTENQGRVTRDEKHHDHILVPRYEYTCWQDSLFNWKDFVFGCHCFVAGFSELKGDRSQPLN
jgi:hypothetical protein